MTLNQCRFSFHPDLAVHKMEKAWLVDQLNKTGGHLSLRIPTGKEVTPIRLSGDPDIFKVIRLFLEASSSGQDSQQNSARLEKLGRSSKAIHFVVVPAKKAAQTFVSYRGLGQVERGETSSKSNFQAPSSALLRPGSNRLGAGLGAGLGSRNFDYEPEHPSGSLLLCHTQSMPNLLQRAGSSSIPSQAPSVPSQPRCGYKQDSLSSAPIMKKRDLKVEIKKQEMDSLEKVAFISKLQLKQLLLFVKLTSQKFHQKYGQGGPRTLSLVPLSSYAASKEAKRQPMLQRRTSFRSNPQFDKYGAALADLKRQLLSVASFKDQVFYKHPTAAPKLELKTPPHLQNIQVPVVEASSGSSRSGVLDRGSPANQFCQVCQEDFLDFSLHLKQVSHQRTYLQRSKENLTAIDNLITQFEEKRVAEASPSAPPIDKYQSKLSYLDFMIQQSTKKVHFDFLRPEEAPVFGKDDRKSFIDESADKVSSSSEPSSSSSSSKENYFSRKSSSSRAEVARCSQFRVDDQISLSDPRISSGLLQRRNSDSQQQPLSPFDLKQSSKRMNGEDNSPAELDEEDDLRFCDSLTLISVSQQFEEGEEELHGRSGYLWKKEEETVQKGKEFSFLTALRQSSSQVHK